MMMVVVVGGGDADAGGQLKSVSQLRIDVFEHFIKWMKMTSIFI